MYLFTLYDFKNNSEKKILLKKSNKYTKIPFKVRAIRDKGKKKSNITSRSQRLKLTRMQVPVSYLLAGGRHTIGSKFTGFHSSPSSSPHPHQP